MSNAIDSIIKKETRISVIISTVLSAAFFFLAFGLSPKVLTTASPDQLALDFIPQSLAIGFFAALMPSLIFGNKRRKGKIDGLDRNPDSVGKILLRSIGFALVAGVTGALIAFVLRLFVAQIAYFPAAAVRVIYGGLLAYIVTPRVLRLSLRP